MPRAQSRGEASPYYNDSHVAWRARCRAFVEQRVIPHCDAWDETGYPRELHREARAVMRAALRHTRNIASFPERGAAPQLYAAGIGGAIFPPEFGGTPPDGCACGAASASLLRFCRCRK